MKEASVYMVVSQGPAAGAVETVEETIPISVDGAGAHHTASLPEDPARPPAGERERGGVP